MKKINILFVLLLIAHFVHSQTNGEAVNSVSANTFFDEFYTTPQAITSTINVAIFGSIDTQTTVRIFPTTQNVIVITPITYVPPGKQGDIGGGTTIKSSGTGTGGGRGTIVLFPNPSTSVIYFQSELERINGYKVYDLYGNLIVTKDLFSLKTGEIDINNFKQGTYIVKFLSEKGETINLFFIKN